MLYSKVSKGSGRSPVVGQLPSKVKPKVNDLDKEEQEEILTAWPVSLPGVWALTRHGSPVSVNWNGIGGTFGVPLHRRIRRCGRTQCRL